MADTQFSIRIQNLDQILATFRQAPTIVAPRISDAINKSLAILAKNGDESTFQFKTPRELRTGYLSASWGAPGNGLSLASPSNLSGRIWTNAGYAIYVHEGTAPHVIRVKMKKVLANKKTGQVFGKEVHHPGNKPNRFIPRIIDKSQSDINVAFKSALDYIIGDIAQKTSS